MDSAVTTNRLLMRVQQDFQLCERPFVVLADELGTDENTLIEEIQGLRSCGVIRRISGTFNLRKFGYHMALVAFDVAPDKLHIAANVLSEQASISHCYIRQDDDFPVWFTLATLKPLEEEIESLAKLCLARRVLNLPATEHFKLSVLFDLETGGVLESPTVTEKSQPLELTAELRQAIRALQMNLKITQKPFDAPAKTAGLSSEALFANAEKLSHAGLLRRYSAVLDHTAAGITANAMVVWEIDPVVLEHSGVLASLNPHVSHCYARKTCEGWPYNLYTMIHARSQKKLDEVIERLCASLDCPPHRILTTMHEIKKSPVIINFNASS